MIADAGNRDAIRDLLQERARLLARLPTEELEQGQTVQLVTFRLGEERYAVDSTMVGEVRPIDRHTWSLVPCTPAFILGAINIRGQIYSVMDIGLFLGLPNRTLPDTGYVLLVKGWDADGDVMEVGFHADVAASVARLARLAHDAGCDGVVSSPQEVAGIKAAHGSDFLVVSPGIRPAGASTDDQARVATAADAVRAGADVLVVGRPIMNAPDPPAVAAALRAEMEEAYGRRG
jgi:chemotaxis signal transduction protein